MGSSHRAVRPANTDRWRLRASTANLHMQLDWGDAAAARLGKAAVGAGLMAALLAGPTLLHAEFKGDLSKSPLVGNRFACLLLRLTASISVNCQTLSFP